MSEPNIKNLLGSLLLKNMQEEANTPTSRILSPSLLPFTGLSQPQDDNMETQQEERAHLPLEACSSGKLMEVPTRPLAVCNAQARGAFPSRSTSMALSASHDSCWLGPISCGDLDGTG